MSMSSLKLGNYCYLFTFQDNIYADKQDTTEEFETAELKTAAIPPTFHKCDKQGAQPGCKYKFDSPQEQCSGSRQGIANWLK